MQRSQRNDVIAAKKTNTHLDLRLNWGFDAITQLLKAFATVSPQGAQRVQQEMAADVDSLLGGMAAELSAQITAALEEEEEIEAGWPRSAVIDTLLGLLTKVEATKAKVELIAAQATVRMQGYGRNAATSVTNTNSALNGRLNYGFQGFAQTVEALAMFSPQRARRVQQEMASHIDSLLRGVAAKISAQITAVLEEREDRDSLAFGTLSNLKATVDTMVDQGDAGLEPLPAPKASLF